MSALSRPAIWAERMLDTSLVSIACSCPADIPEKLALSSAVICVPVSAVIWAA